MENPTHPSRAINRTRKPMTKMAIGQKSSPPKTSWRGSYLEFRRMNSMLSLALLLFLSVYSVIFARAFSTATETARGGRTQIHTMNTFLGIGSDNRKIISTRSSTSTMLLAGLFGEQTKVKNQNNTYISPTSDWQVYVDQSRVSLDRGGAATFDAFFSLCDTSVDGLKDDGDGAVEVQVIPAILPKPASGGKGPWIRCVWNTNNKKNTVRPSPNLDVANVDSVEKVYRVLTRHLGLTNISVEACECLKWKYKGNTHLDSGEIKPAINAYNQALEICEEYFASASDRNDADTKSYNSVVLKQQEGIILLLRASAYMQQAQSHKEILQTVITGDGVNMPSPEVLQALLSEALHPSSTSFSSDSLSPEQPSDGDSTETSIDGMVSESAIDDAEEATVDLTSDEGDATVDANTENEAATSSPLLSSQSTDSEINDKSRENDPQTAVRLSVLRMLKTNGNLRKAQLRKIQYRHGLYKNSLLQATRDSLRATEVLPSYPTAWLRAGELLSDLWKIKESKQYYEKAISIDNSLEESLSSALKGLEERQELVDRARGNKVWPGDSLQLALDIAG